MKAHIVEKTYSNGASAIREVFTSKVGAIEWVERYMQALKDDGYSVYLDKHKVLGDKWVVTSPNLEQEYWRVVSMEMRKY